MQRLLLTVTCFFLPVFSPSLNAITELAKAVIVYDAKLIICLFTLAVSAGIYAVVNFLKFLFNGYQLKHFWLFLISTAVCWITFVIANQVFKGAEKRITKLVRSEFFSLRALKI